MDSDRQFAGSIPQIYDELLVPLLFAPYAEDLAHRLRALAPRRVLETAAGTGVVTRALARTLERGTRLVATDLNQPMLDRAAGHETAAPIEWRQADALALPFADAEFDAVVCQFGVMFFPDKARAYAEAFRVLRPGGVLLFNTWDAIAENEFADAVTGALAAMFPEDPPRFLARVPHGYHDEARIREDLAGGGFRYAARIETLSARSRAPTPQEPAVAYCQGTPLRSEIEARDASRLAEATAAAAGAIARRFGPGPVQGKIQALVVEAER